MYIDVVKSLLEDLKERFSKKDLEGLLQDVHSLKQGKMNVTQFFSYVTILIETWVSKTHIKLHLWYSL